MIKCMYVVFLPQASLKSIIWADILHQNFVIWGSWITWITIGTWHTPVVDPKYGKPRTMLADCKYSSMYTLLKYTVCTHVAVGQKSHTPSVLYHRWALNASEIRFNQLFDFDSSPIQYFAEWIRIPGCRETFWTMTMKYRSLVVQQRDQSDHGSTLHHGF